MLAVDPKSSIDVVVARTGGRGVVKGIAGDNRYRTRIENLLRSDEVAEGDVVVTSGLGGVPAQLRRRQGGQGRASATSACIRRPRSSPRSTSRSSTEVLVVLLIATSRRRPPEDEAS